jgi:phosphatidate cytidylyltransferase
MLLKRTLAAVALALVGIPAIILGGYFYFGIIAIFLVVAAWELGRIFAQAGSEVAQPLLVGGVLLLVTSRVFFPALASTLLSLLVLAAMIWHLIDYEKGRDTAATDFAATSAGILYLGWIGPYLIDLRNLPSGLAWLALVLPSVWIADSAAYFIGRRYGRHPLSPRLSPKKTWEGYWGGIIFGILGTIGLALLWNSLGCLVITWWQAALLGAVIASLTTLGDLGESMFKRQAGVKDSSNLIPGHGGAFDRIDSWLWAGVLGYFFITWFLI